MFHDGDNCRVTEALPMAARGLPGLDSVIGDVGGQIAEPQSSTAVPNTAAKNHKDLSSFNPKTWKRIRARLLRKYQEKLTSGQGNCPTFPKRASIGVPLRLCVPSEENVHVPKLVVHCTEIIEQKGLDNVGIYRIPGKTAAIAALTKQVNRGFDEETMMDPKWKDLNVVCSLLISFIRNLPEPLLPKEIYTAFISADKKSGRERMSELKTLVNALPPLRYETTKHLLRHLYRVSQNCRVNMMGPKNLAIIFGPSIVSATNVTLETALEDMTHQVKIVESLVSEYEYFFEKDPIPNVAELPTPMQASKGLDDCVIRDVGCQIAEPQSLASIKRTIQTPSATSDENSAAQNASTASEKYYWAQSVAAIKIIPTPSATSDDISGVQNASTASKKYYLGSRSLSGQSPVTKRSIQEKLASGQGNCPTFPKGASIGVPLRLCVPFEDNVHVPKLVVHCTEIIEQKGLDNVGIYRIPGETAAIAALTKQLNRGFDEGTMMDPKWKDLDVVCSLLKSFILNLPEPLRPKEIYTAIISADKKSGRKEMSELKTIVNALSPFRYETTIHLLRHLYRVSQNCRVNMMGPKNLVIIFGPSIVSATNETLETALEDMTHQVKIVESLVSEYEYFFEKDPIPDLAELPTPMQASKGLDVRTFFIFVLGNFFFLQALSSNAVTSVTFVADTIDGPKIIARFLGPIIFTRQFWLTR
ncbi:hypothetical protein DMENIID0001_107260 [Sergentomyia squamirostris]